MDQQIIGLQDVLGRLQDDKELLLELIQIFLDDTPFRLEEVRKLIAKCDAEELANAAHSVKGAASNIGANKLWQSFKEMEQAAKDKDFPLVEQIYQRVITEFKELQVYFPELKSRLIT